jgi:type VI secretion system secreted protein Hcp
MAVQDYFLVLKDIEGESTDKKCPKAIILQGYSVSAYVPRDAASHEASGKVSFGALTCTKHVDKSSPKLLRAMWTNQKLNEGKVVIRKAGKEQEPYLVYEFKNMYVASVSASGSADGSLIPTEVVTFVYGQIEIKYREQQADGTLGGEISEGYNLGTGH